MGRRCLQQAKNKETIKFIKEAMATSSIETVKKAIAAATANKCDGPPQHGL